jgi:hypothetical protein
MAGNTFAAEWRTGDALARPEHARNSYNSFRPGY